MPTSIRLLDSLPLKGALYFVSLKLRLANLTWVLAISILVSKDFTLASTSKTFALLRERLVAASSKFFLVTISPNNLREISDIDPSFKEMIKQNSSGVYYMNIV